MHRILGLPTRLFGLTAALLLFAACGQNEGGRCQVSSDCGSGLLCCNGQSGNGTCRVSCVSSDDASSGSPGTSGDAPLSTPDGGTDLVLVSSMNDAISEAATVDSADFEAGGETGGLD